MSNWSDYTGEATKGTGGGDWGAIPDDIYAARVMDVSEPETGPNQFRPGEERTQFYITWELDPTSEQIENGCGLKADGTQAEEVSMRQYMSIPEGIRKGYINEKSKLFEVMSALGFDLDETVTFNPPDWIDMKARVVIENVAREDGSERPRVIKVMTATRAKPAARPAAPAGRR